jgi:hypothetical protein
LLAAVEALLAAFPARWRTVLGSETARTTFRDNFGSLQRGRTLWGAARRIGAFGKSCAICG